MTRPSRLADVRVDTVDDRQPLGRYLLLLFRAFEEELLATLAREGWSDVGMADLQVLHFVRPEGSSAVELARLAGVSKQAIARTVGSLQSRGYLRRRVSGEDARLR
jgi:DNA-binding MarR family transcriptional regulator